MNRKGFTLIELLIVVVIIGILAAIAIPKFANTKAKAYIASMKSDLRNLVTAEEAYFADSVKYTATTACTTRSEEHTSELQSRLHLVCRLLLEKKKKEIHLRHLHDMPTTTRMTHISALVSLIFR